MFPKPFGDLNFEDCKENFEYFISTYKPASDENGPIKYGPDQEEGAAKIDPQKIWTEIQLDTTCITNGFLPASKDSRVSGYYVCELPIDDEALSITLFTEVQVECEKCEGEGEVKDRTCKKCDGEGSTYRYLNEIWPSL